MLEDVTILCLRTVEVALLEVLLLEDEGLDVTILCLRTVEVALLEMVLLEDEGLEVAIFGPPSEIVETMLLGGTVTA